MSSTKTRVRFAPSPTGPLHMGGVRTALYNYLYAKQRGGDFILRIEDTDSQRFVPGAEQYIIEALKWCGIYPDEGVDAEGNIIQVASPAHPHAPYRQSERKPLYRAYAEELISKGFAYYAFDTPEELNAKRQEAEQRKETFIYNHSTRMGLRNSLTLPAEEVANLVATRTDWTIRFKTPENRVVKMDDLIRGHIEINTSTIDDKVLWKAADGLPTYHLANIVDDHLMEITEVIRGEEWLPSLPLHYLLYEAFGWQDSQPRFAHLSLLLKPDGKGKLSKRDGDRLGFPVFPLRWVNSAGEVSRGYREDGYYPEAFVNMLALLGWNPGTEQEIFSLQELVEAFSLERVIKSGARFNPDKAKWFNQHYLRAKSGESLAADFIQYIDNAGKEIVPIKSNQIAEKLFGALSPEGERASALKIYLAHLCELIRERAHFVSDFWSITRYFFIAPESYEEKDVKKFCTPDNKAAMEEIRELITSCPFSALGSLIADGNCSKELVEQQRELIESTLTGRITERGWKMGQVMNTLRLFFAGEAKGLGIADIILYIGKEETLRRIDAGMRLFA